VPHPDYGLKLKILGVVRCDALQADDVPAEGLPSRVILDEAYRSALNGVEVGDFLYVLVIFHLPGARGPTDSTGKECVDGAFSIRTSVRPNLIGMTLSKVTAIDGMEIYFEWLDFVDGTPVIDLKRYSWRWECALSTRRLDRRVAEKQFSRDALGANRDRAQGQRQRDGRSTMELRRRRRAVPRPRDTGHCRRPGYRLVRGPDGVRPARTGESLDPGAARWT
jgi:formylmethanofuran dehydrogenase subunit E